MNPGDFPLGSEQSRAAARRLADERNAGCEWTRLIVDIGPNEVPTQTPWVEDKNGRRGCIMGLPEGMAVEEADRILAGQRSKSDERRISEYANNDV